VGRCTAFAVRLPRAGPHRQDKRAAHAYKPIVSTARLEEALRNFSGVATLVKSGARRQTWRFTFDGRDYYLYFYPRGSSANGALRGPNPSHREFFGLQTLQKASVSSPRAVAQLSGFRIDDALGDAVIVEAIQGATRMDEFLLDHELRGEPIPNRRQLALQLRTILHQLGRAGLGHPSLRLGSFLVSGQRVYLRDGAGVRRGGMRQAGVMRLAHEASRYATRSELRRAWDLLMPGTEMPRRNPQSPRLWREFLRGIFRDNEAFGLLIERDWKGAFSKRSPHARRWAVSSRLDIKHEDWRRAWPRLLERIERRELRVLKSDPSGDVFSANVELAGTTVPVIIKRPKRKVWWRYVFDVARPARARRTWIKAWKAIVRNLPTEWPLLVMERRMLGYVTDGILIFERVPGVTLDHFDLDSLDRRGRDLLFHRAGRTLRTLEDTNLAHYDAKSTNWIVVNDEQVGPVPVMIDLDGIRMLLRKLQGFGIQRLLRAMRQHPQYTPADSLALCQGFAPFTPVVRAQAVQASGESA
jgi:hypothetical protein